MKKLTLTDVKRVVAEAIKGTVLEGLEWSVRREWKSAGKRIGEGWRVYVEFVDEKPLGWEPERLQDKLDAWLKANGESLRWRNEFCSGTSGVKFLSVVITTGW